MLTFDIHCHFFPQAFLDVARQPGNSFQASIERRADGREHLVCAGNFDHPLTPDFYDAQRMIEDMDQVGMQMAAISSAPPTLSYWADPGAARTGPGHQREHRRVRAHPDRFAGLGTVPLQDVDASVAEARRAIRDLGLAGLMIGSNVNGKNLDHPDFYPFFAAIAELDAPLFIHPYIPAGPSACRITTCTT